MEKILVLGSNGFLGKNILKILGNEENIISIPGKSFLDLKNFDNLNEFVNGKNIKSVINCAAFVGGISFGYKYQADLLTKNLDMGNNIYKVAKENNISRIINPISNCAYPGDIEVYKEVKFWDGKPHDSVLYYGLAKRIFVALAESYYTQYGVSSVSVILSNMYGPHDHFEEERSHALGALIRKIHNAKIKKEDSVEVWGTGEQKREWLNVNDGANALIKSLDIPEGNYVFNVGINESISIKDLAEIIKKYLKYKGELIYNSSKPQGVENKQVDGTLGSKILNWSPEVELETGIKDTIEWYVKNYGK